MKAIRNLYITIAVSLSLFHLWGGWAGPQEAWRQRSIHLVLILALVFLTPRQKKAENAKEHPFRILDYIYWGMMLFVGPYILIEYNEIIFRGGAPNLLDKLAAAFLVILIIVATYRKTGLSVAILASIFLLYGLFGHYVPGYVGHGEISIRKLVDQLFNSTYGIFGPALAAASDFIIIFIIFGAFLNETKASHYFVNFSYALTGHLVGGPAKTAVVASALVGSIHGSGPGNVATTGTFTIPLMKSVGYKPAFAGGVEAAASTGGILMPPVMGSAAFIMSAMLGVPYNEIIIAAAIPAILYYLSIFMMTDIEARRRNLGTISEKEKPPLLKSLKSVWILLLPIIVLLYMLLQGKSASRSGLMAIICLILSSSLNRDSRLTFSGFIHALEQGATNMCSISTICAAAGIVVGMLSVTGIGVKLGALVMIISQGKLFLSLLLMAIVAMILGMGMPGVAAYIIIAATVAPAIVNLGGIPPIAAHLFAFYYSQMSNLTPPVALSSYAAAAIAKSDMWATAKEGFRLAVIGLLIPFAFIYNNALLFMGGKVNVFYTLALSAIAVCAFSAGLMGSFGSMKFSYPSRLVIMLGSIMLVFKGAMINSIGIAIIILLFSMRIFLPKFKKP